MTMKINLTQHCKRHTYLTILDLEIKIGEITAVVKLTHPEQKCSIGNP